MPRKARTTKSSRMKSSRMKSSRMKSSLTERSDLVLPDFARYFFILAIVFVLIMFLWVISPFINVLIYSALIAIVFYPVDLWLEKRLKHKSLAAFCTTLLVILIVLVPLTFFTVFIAQEAVDAYDILEINLEDFDFDALSFENLSSIPVAGEALQAFSERYDIIDIFKRVDFNLLDAVKDIGETVSTFIVSQSGNIVKGLGDTVVSIFILLLTLYFFFRDGSEVGAFLKKMSPMPTKYEDEIEKKLKATTYGIVVGNFGTALLQGIAGTIGFALAGVENAVFWGTIMAFASLIPYIGASIVWAPVVVVLLIQQNLFWGGFLAVWGLLVISSVDNIARPYLIGSSTKMHPLATFLVVLGGIFVFGMKGIIFGPLILSLAVTILHIYQLEYKDVLKA